MRHRIARRKLNRTSEHRRALRRNMAQSLFEHGMIKTTLPKAKDLQPFAERLITLARKAHGGSLAARQRLTKLMGDRAMIPADFQEAYEEMSDAERAKVLRSRSGRRHRFGQAKGGMDFTAKSVLHHLIHDVAPRFDGRPGGYTRVIKLGQIGKGDSSLRAMLQLVGQEDSPGSVTRPEKTTRRRRAERRYAAAAKAIKQSSAKADQAKAAPSQQDQDQESAQGSDAQESSES